MLRGIGPHGLRAFAVEADTVPIEDAIGGVGVLLDFENHVAGTQGMNPAAGEKHDVARLDGEAVEAIGDSAIVDFGFEFFWSDAAFKADEQIRVGRCLGDIPHFGLGLAAHFRGFAGGRMDLQGELFLGVEDFYQERESFFVTVSWAEQFFGMIFHEPAEVLVRQGAVGNHAGIARAIGNLPGFADGHAGREGFLVKAL